MCVSLPISLSLSISPQKRLTAIVQSGKKCICCEYNTNSYIWLNQVTQKNNAQQSGKWCFFCRRTYAIHILWHTNYLVLFSYLSVSIIQVFFILRNNVCVPFNWHHVTFRTGAIFIYLFFLKYLRQEKWSCIFQRLEQGSSQKRVYEAMVWSLPSLGTGFRDIKIYNCERI